MSGLRGRVLLGCALVALVALQAAAVFRVAFNWDELALLEGVARTAREGELVSGGHAGLPQLVLLPLVEGCRDEIAVGRTARLLWLALTLAYGAGLFVTLRELGRGTSHRDHDAALGTALLVALPVFLEWSIQVRADQVALAGGAWGTAALLASRRRPAFAVAAGLAFGVGWLGTQKLAYVGALAALLAAGDVAVRREWRPGREAARAAVSLACFGAVVLAWRAFALGAFEMPEHHPAVQTASPVVVESYLDVFDFYRATIGYSQYVEVLPSLGPHLLLLLGLAIVPLLSPAARTPRVALAWAVLAAGVGIGAFHAAAFAYFVMTLGLFPVVAIALALPALREAFARWEPRLVRPVGAVLWGVVAVQAALHMADALHDTQAVQRESLRFVHRNFADEHAGFHPEAGLFCGPEQPLGVWFSQTLYRRFESPRRDRNVERLLEQFRAEPVHYLVHSFRLNQFPAPVRRFWAEHYQPYRDSVFVAGSRLEGDAGETQRFELLVEGPYRWLPLDAPHPIGLDGEPLEPGAVRVLATGDHAARFGHAGTRGILVLALGDPPGPAPLRFYKAY